MDCQSDVQRLLDSYRTTRALSLQLIATLTDEDCQLQSMADASPAKWHLAHTTWFFETFILRRQSAAYRPFDRHYEHLFNSYYNAVGTPFSRPQRGLLSRPSLETIRHYRAAVDTAMEHLLETAIDSELLFLLELGIHHEQQHQELLLMDIKHAFAQNPLLPAYRDAHPQATDNPPSTLSWRGFSPQLVSVGNSGDGFCFDNERPAHRVYLNDFQLAGRPVNNAEFAEFIADGGYRNPLLWHADGWAALQAQQRAQPLYWRQREGAWEEFTLHGLLPLNPAAPVCHLSWFEASAYAQWCGCRLPTEFEWEYAAQFAEGKAHYLELDSLHPRAPETTGLQGMLGGCWEWTASSYAPYPGFQPFASDAGEYNGKFMVGQYVLRGGSCLTPAGHTRTTYRNFFYPHQSWPMCGMRLAKD